MKSEFEKIKGFLYNDAVKYLKKLGVWEQNKQYSGYEIVALASYMKKKTEEEDDEKKR